MRAHIIRPITGGEYQLVEDLDRDRRPAIMDCEGDRVMDVPPLLIHHVDDTAVLDTILITLIDQLEQAQLAAYRRGEQAGVDHTVAFTRKLLGTDQLAASVEETHRAVHNLNENLWRLLRKA